MKRPNWRRAILAALGGILAGGLGGAVLAPYLVALVLSMAGVRVGFPHAVAIGKVGAVVGALICCFTGWRRGWTDEP